jgi:hypothetical protein
MKIDVKDQKTQLVIGVIVLGIGVLSYLFLKNKPLGVDTTTIDPNKIQPEPITLDKNLVLKQGSENPEVAEMQRILKEKYGQDLGTFGDNKDGIDGIFGTVTLAGLLKAKGVSQIALKDL